MLQSTGYPAEIANFYSAISAGYRGFFFGCYDRAARYVSESESEEDQHFVNLKRSQICCCNLFNTEIS